MLEIDIEQLKRESLKEVLRPHKMMSDDLDKKTYLSILSTKIGKLRKSKTNKNSEASDNELGYETLPSVTNTINEDKGDSSADLFKSNDKEGQSNIWDDWWNEKARQNLKL